MFNELQEEKIQPVPTIMPLGPCPIESISCGGRYFCSKIYCNCSSHMAALCSGEIFNWGGQYSSPEPKWLVHASNNATLYAVLCL